MRLLYVEDDVMLGEATTYALKECYTVDWVSSAEDADHALATTEYDLVILDVKLPGISGLELLHQLRRGKNSTPILLLTAMDDRSDRVKGLDAGADDYLVKPFDLEELFARIRALLRRSHGRATPVLEHAGITYDVAAQLVTYQGKTLSLSAKELSLIAVFLENIGKVLSKSTLEEKLYGWNEEIGSNTIEVYVSSLRHKLGKQVIKTIRGVGYIMERQEHA